MRIPRHKFGAKPQRRDNMRFDSKLEARYYDQLKIRQADGGDVLFFLRQVPLHLIAGVKLVIDFVVFLVDGSVEFIDTKGFDTPTSNMKIKMAEEIYPFQIKLVRKV